MGQKLRIRLPQSGLGQRIHAAIPRNVVRAGGHPVQDQHQAPGAARAAACAERCRRRSVVIAGYHLREIGPGAPGRLSDVYEGARVEPGEHLRSGVGVGLARRRHEAFGAQRPRRRGRIGHPDRAAALGGPRRSPLRASGAMN